MPDARPAGAHVGTPFHRTHEMPTYLVRSTDREKTRKIKAESPGRAAAAYLGSRCATLRMNHWNRSEYIFGASVKVGDGPFRMGRDAVRSVRVYVELAPDAVRPELMAEAEEFIAEYADELRELADA